jgi:hypothetical protein
MSRVASVEPMPNMVGFINPDATNSVGSSTRLEDVQGQFLSSVADVDVINRGALPQDVLAIGDHYTLIYSDGGDGTVRKVIAAVIGVVPNDPEGTARNFTDHQAIAPNTRYFAGAGGNANNWPLSAHLKYAAHPNGLKDAQISVGFHRPLMYEVVDASGEIIQSDIATSCLGLGASAIAAQAFEKAKTELSSRGSTRRLLGELAIALEVARKAPTFAVALTAGSGESQRTLYQTDVTGLELIKSRIYAKQGRTKVNVDDTKWQPVILRRPPHVAGDIAQQLNAIARLKSGHHALPTEDLSDHQLSIRIAGIEPVLFHVDGETDGSNMLLPGDTLRLHLARIAVPTLMVRK